MPNPSDAPSMTSARRPGDRTQAEAQQRPVPAATGGLSRADRLGRSEEFRRVMKKGRRAQGSHVGLFALRTASPRHRIGLAVSVGVGHSPARARMRRLLREAFRVLRQRMTVSQSVDLVILARQPWPGASLADVVAELTQLGAQLRLTEA